MGDVITSSNKNDDVEAGGVLGLTTLRDNHGNSYSGYTLTCAGKQPAQMSLEQHFEMADLLEKASFPEHATIMMFFTPDGELPMYFGMESPLQTVCRQMQAQQHHAPQAHPQHRAK